MASSLVPTFFNCFTINREDNGTKKVEPLIPSEGSKPGDKVLIEGYETGTPDAVLNPKKKIWEKLQVQNLILNLKNF